MAETTENGSSRVPVSVEESVSDHGRVRGMQQGILGYLLEAGYQA